MNKNKANGNGEHVWLVIGDIHGDGANIAKLADLGEAEALLISGDMTNCGDPAAAQNILDLFTSRGIPVYAQFGNMDLPPVNGWLDGKNINLHRAVRPLSPQTVAFGVGGSTPTPMNTPTEFPESDYAAWLAEEWQKAKEYPRKILISHNPPKNTLCDDIGGDVHVGSQAVREFIEKHQPDICVCGHIHESRAVDKIGNTIIINPGAFADGGYVKITEKDGQVQACLKQVND